MSGVEMLLGILVIQMFFVIFGNIKRNEILDNNGAILSLNKGSLGAIYEKLCEIDNEVATIDPRKHIVGEVKAISENINNIYKRTEDMERMTNLLDNISANTNEIRENTRP